jgi:hypothetical protein
MKKLDLSAVSSTTQFPVKEGTLDFINLAYQEALTALANNLIGVKTDTANGYILYGCLNTGSGLVYIISAGAIFFNGEVYLVPAASFTSPGGQVAVCNLSVIQYTTNADPVVFTDGITRNVHNVRQIIIASAVSASGLFDFSVLRQTAIGLKNDEQDRASFFNSATANVAISFSFTDAVPGTVVRMKWTFGAGLTLTINVPGGGTIIRDSGTLANVASANNLLYFIYLGKNEAGNNEVSYTLKQF